MNQGRGLEYYQTIVYSDIYNQQLLSAVEQDSTLKAFGAVRWRRPGLQPAEGFPCR
jgi:hypothetical protein